MDVELKNARFVQPVVDEISLAVKILTAGFSRNALIVEEDYTSPVSEILLSEPVVLKSWVEVYVDGFRLINASLDFGKIHQDFEVLSDRIVFHTAQTGHIKVVMDRQTNSAVMPIENCVKVSNEQGAKTKAIRTGDLYVAYFCEPLILTEPLHGYVRLSDDHLSLTYYPDAGYQGYDAFSYSVITERGQLATPKCVYVKVGDPKPTEDTNSPVTPA